jgi:phosphoesterase RecJ-like protein
MTIENVVNAISKAKNIAIIGHIMPDGDAIGSCLALYYSIKRLSKKSKSLLYGQGSSNPKFSKGC